MGPRAPAFPPPLASRSGGRLEASVTHTAGTRRASAIISPSSGTDVVSLTSGLPAGESLPIRAIATLIQLGTAARPSRPLRRTKTPSPFGQTCDPPEQRRAPDCRVGGTHAVLAKTRRDACAPGTFRQRHTVPPITQDRPSAIDLGLAAIAPGSVRARLPAKSHVRRLDHRITPSERLPLPPKGTNHRPPNRWRSVTRWCSAPSQIGEGSTLASSSCRWFLSARNPAGCVRCNHVVCPCSPFVLPGRPLRPRSAVSCGHSMPSARVRFRCWCVKGSISTPLVRAQLPTCVSAAPRGGSAVRQTICRSSHCATGSTSTAGDSRPDEAVSNTPSPGAQLHRASASPEMRSPCSGFNTDPRAF